MSIKNTKQSVTISSAPKKIDGSGDSEKPVAAEDKPMIINGDQGRKAQYRQ